MNISKFNWQIWAGFLLSIFAAFSYPSIFVQYPITRDFPWVSLLLFFISSILLFIGLRRAFSAGRKHPRLSKAGGVILATLVVAVAALFLFGWFVFARQLPASHQAPHVGQTAPDFTLPDTNAKQVSLSELLSSPIDGKTPKGVLLVFYRGYW